MASLRMTGGAAVAAPCEPGLGPREWDVLIGGARGESVEETARRLHYSYASIKFHRASLLRRLGARSFPHAVALAFANGLLTSDDIEPRSTA